MVVEMHKMTRDIRICHALRFGKLVGFLWKNKKSTISNTQIPNIYTNLCHASIVHANLENLEKLGTDQAERNQRRDEHRDDERRGEHRDDERRLGLRVGHPVEDILNHDRDYRLDKRNFVPALQR